jgi:hypothetical protein
MFITHHLPWHILTAKCLVDHQTRQGNHGSNTPICDWDEDTPGDTICTRLLTVNRSLVAHTALLIESFI